MSCSCDLVVRPRSLTPCCVPLARCLYIIDPQLGAWCPVDFVLPISERAHPMFLVLLMDPSRLLCKGCFGAWQMHLLQYCSEPRHGFLYAMAAVHAARM